MWLGVVQCLTSQKTGTQVLDSFYSTTIKNGSKACIKLKGQTWAQSNMQTLMVLISTRMTLLHLHVLRMFSPAWHRPWQTVTAYLYHERERKANPFTISNRNPGLYAATSMKTAEEAVTAGVQCDFRPKLKWNLTLHRWPSLCIIKAQWLYIHVAPTMNNTSQYHDTVSYCVSLISVPWHGSLVVIVVESLISVPWHGSLIVTVAESLITIPRCG